MKKIIFLTSLAFVRLVNKTKNTSTLSSFGNQMALQNYMRIALLLVMFLFESSSFGQCFEIESILVDPCNSTNPINDEGFNEMVRFKVGSTPLNTANLSVVWANLASPWGGIIQNTTTAAVVNQLNAQINNAGNCGQILEPIAGILPANATVLLVTSQNFNTSFNSLANLTSTVYIIFQNNSSNTGGHFSNYSITAGTRTLTMTFDGVCTDTVTYERSLLINTAGGYGGTTAQNDGATVNFSTTGVPTYVNNGCQIIINSLPTAAISYSGSPFCQSLTSIQPTISGTGAYTGGTYSSTTGLVINPSTGEINPSLSSSGTYIIKYNILVNGGCIIVLTTTQVTITTTPIASISYSGNPFCKSLTTAQAVTLTGTGTYTGGSFSSSTGLSINSTTGAITPSTSTAGSYTVTYTTTASSGCSAVSTTTSVSIVSSPTVSISYPISPYYTTITTPQPVTLTGTGNYLGGNYYSYPNGLYINDGTGDITPSLSNPGVYEVFYTTPTSGGCSTSVSTVVEIWQPNIGNLSITSTNTAVGLFDTITVNVQLTNATDLYSLYMKLKGNAAVSQYLDYTGYTAGTLLGSGGNIISTAPTATNGVYDFGITKVGSVPGYAGSGLFYTFTFVPKNITIPTGTTFCFYLDNINAYNSSGISCNVSYQGQYCYTFTNQVNVWPGDLNNTKTVTTADLLPIGYFYNSQGPTRPNASIQWTAQPTTLWGHNHSTGSGDGYKAFADSNGDGVINNADQAAIGFNMNKIHAKTGSSAPSPAPPHFTTQQLATAGGTLTVTPNTTIINGAVLPQTVTFIVSVNNTGGLSALYGTSVNLLFDETIFDLNTATVDYTGSIFGVTGTDCLALNFNSTTMVSVGLTRYANAAINGQGLLFKVTIQTKTTLPNLTQTPVTAYVDAANNQAGDTLVIQDAPVTNLTIINNLGIDTIKADEFVLYPNPANDMIHLVMGTNTSQLNNFKLKVITILGQTVEEMHIQNPTTDLSTKNWGAAGVYFVQITNSDNTFVMTKKVIVSRK